MVTSVDNGTLYVNDPIHLTDDSTLKFVAVSADGQSTVKTESYLIDIAANRPPGALGSVGPVDSTTGYPFWYGDKGGTRSSLAANRLELCLDDPLCPVVGELPDASKPLSYPDNFPDESFWWSGEAAIAVPGGPSSLLVLAQEAAFGGAGAVVPGEQISFARLRIRLDDVVPDAKYTVTSPYGVDVVTADDRGRARMTEDIGCAAAPCTWKESLDGRVGPFLRWDPAVAPAAPVGYVGNPLVEHQVVGSPRGTNFFRIEGPDIGGPGVNRVETDLFTVQGRLAQLRATATPGGGLYSKAQDVAIQASFPAEAKVVWTTNGSDPAVDPATGAVTNGQELLPATGDQNAKAVVRLPDGRSTLKFMAVDLVSHEASQIYTEEYAVEGALPTVSATPDPATGPFQGVQHVTLTSSAAGSGIYYTTDGTVPKLDVEGNPVGTTAEYAGPVSVGRPTTVKAAAVSALGTLGPVATFVYDIHNLKTVGPVSATNGYPSWFEDYGSSTLPPVKLELCLDDPLCPIVGDVPDTTKPVSFPDNFPDESFWWAGNADFAVGAGRARLTLATEAAFASPNVQAGQQIAFSRIRIRSDALVPGATYRVTHPYGVLQLTADAAGVINTTDDSGCLAAPCDFSQVLRAPVGPFLRWTGTDAPPGYVGDGATPHTVQGSPYGTNVFRIEQLTSGTGDALTTPTIVGQTNQFVVQGKLTALRATATPAGGTYTAAKQVALSSTDPTAAIFYTTNGTTPTAASTRYAGPITIANQGTTVLKFVAIANGVSSPVVTETYLIDTIAPTVAISPSGGTFTTAQSVTITSNDAAASIYYTTDGSTPTASSTRYTTPVTVSRTLTLRARAIDTAGNIGTVVASTFTINQPTTTLTLGTPTPATVTIGAATTLSGSLTSGGTAQASRTVTVQSRALGSSTWVDAGRAAITASNGTYSVAVSPTATVDYRVVFAGATGLQASTSAAQRVQVRAALTLNAPNPVSVSRGRNVTYSGRLAPTHTGARITVTVTATGQRALTASATVAANGTWTVTTKAPGKEGTWNVAASWGGDADHLAPTTANVRLTVVK
ncbi:MAG: chitobiase/beta-hexosaminidase C-terminal domain-containing protein [Nocardioidaceae bacterium]|nr:chitobiase/beta-hexosaminidase C-terminal domain-containing protein [Nocardioidaceae bacterium]